MTANAAKQQRALQRLLVKRRNLRYVPLVQTGTIIDRSGHALPTIAIDKACAHADPYLLRVNH